MAASGARWVGIASGLWAASDDLVDYRRAHHIGIPLSLDQSGDIFRQFGVVSVPTLLVVDPNGRITARVDRVDSDLRHQLALDGAAATGAAR